MHYDYYRNDTLYLEYYTIYNDVHGPGYVYNNVKVISLQPTLTITRSSCHTVVADTAIIVDYHVEFLYYFRFTKMNNKAMDDEMDKKQITIWF